MLRFSSHKYSTDTEWIKGRQLSSVPFSLQRFNFSNTDAFVGFFFTTFIRSEQSFQGLLSACSVSITSKQKKSQACRGTYIHNKNKLNTAQRKINTKNYINRPHVCLLFSGRFCIKKAHKR